MLNLSQRGLGTNFFGHAKFEVKNFSELFHLQSTLDSELFRGGVGAKTFLVTLTFLEFFHLQSTLDSEFFRGGVWVPTFLVMLNLR